MPNARLRPPIVPSTIPPERRDSLGEQIDKFFGGVGHFVEELVERR